MVGDSHVTHANCCFELNRNHNRNYNHNRNHSHNRYHTTGPC